MRLIVSGSGNYAGVANDLLDEYARYLRFHDKSEGTIEQYLNYPTRLLASNPHMSATDYTLDDIAIWCSQFRWESNTKRHATKTLRLFFAWAHKLGHIETDPLADMQTVKGERTLPRPVPELVLARAMRNAPPADRWLLRLLAETGIRRSEAARVQRDDAEWMHGGWWLRVTKAKGNKSRHVPISDELAQWVRAFPRWCFASPCRDGEHVIPSVIGKRVKRLLEGYTCHTLRHRFGTVTFAETGDLRAVQELLGHESVATTQIYTLVANTKLRLVAESAHLDALPRVA